MIWWSVKSPKMKLLAIQLFLLASLHVPGVFPENKNKVSPEDVKEFMRNIGDQNNLTYNQIKEFFEELQKEKKKFDDYPRLFSLCVSAEQAATRTRSGEYLRKFVPILAEMEAVPRLFYEFNASRDSFAQGKNHDWINYMTVSRINTPEADMVNLRQWMHIKVIAKKELRGLYMQSVVGPLGLPFGEFSVEFPCKDIPSSSDIDKVGQISFCSHRPKAAIIHPAVYIGVSDTPRKEFHAHFKWSDITCFETPYLQFIMIAVEDFVDDPEIDKHFKPILSPVFKNLVFDSKDGAAYPYYLDWKDKMYCSLDEKEFHVKYPIEKISNKTGADANFSALTWIEAETDANDTAHAIFRVQPNEHYDACITGVSMKDRDDDRLECPPGPFQCDKSYKDTVVHNETVLITDKVTGEKRNKTQADWDEEDAARVHNQRNEALTGEKANEECFPCAAPACGPELGFPAHICKGKPPVTVNNTDFLETLATTSGSKNHAGLAILAFLVLIPISNFLGRFYKEVGTNFLCGNGPWICLHSGLHIVSLLIMWLSLGPVAPAIGEHASVYEQCLIAKNQDKNKATECAKKQSADNPHVVIGIIAFILQNFIVLFGFFRASNNAVRFIQVILHSHVGYLTYILGGISSIIAAAGNACGDSMVFNVLLFLIPFLASAVGVVLDFMTDSRVGIRPGRKQWPVLEPIKIEGRGPFTMIKWILLGGLGGLMGFLWFLAFVNYTYTSSGDATFLEDKDYINSSILEDYKPASIFGLCSKSFL